MYVGWGVFAVSMFLPVLHLFGDRLCGWQCAYIVLMWFWQHLRGAVENNGMMYGCAFANIWLLLTPMLLRSRKWSPLARRFGLALTLSAALFATLFPAWNGIPAYADLSIGYYAWVASFWLVFIGVLQLQSNPKATPKTDDTPVSAPQTEQEIAARRELETFLRS